MPRPGRKTASLANVPAWAWWTERLTVGLVLAQWTAAVAGSAGVGGASPVVGVTAVASALGVVAALDKVAPTQRRLRPGVAADGVRRRDLRLVARLLDGGPIEPAERPVVGRLAWSILAGNTVGAWTEASVACGAPAGLFDGAGSYHWAWGWPTVWLVVGLLASIMLVRTVRESARWWRIAVDPDRAEAPVAT